MVRFQGDAKTILIIFIAIIMAVVFIDVIADQTYAVTTTLDAVNVTVTVPTANNDLSILGRTLIGSAVVINTTDNSAINATNYTIQTKIVNGKATIVYTNLEAKWNGIDVKTSYSYEPEGYVRESSSRTLVLLVVLFGALAIIIFIISRLMKDSSLKQFLRMK